MFVGLHFNYSEIILVVLGFLVFLLIFFGNEDAFESVYFTIKKRISNLEESDKLDKTLKLNKKTIVEKEEGNQGLIKEHILKIKDNLNKHNDKLVNIRKVLPYAILIALNYIVYIIKIVNLDTTNLAIIGFQLKFLLYSFCIGGILAISMLFVYYIKHHKKIKIKITKHEKYISYSLTSIILIMSFINIRFIILQALVFLYFFIKIARVIEGKMFIHKKPIKEIVLGDWIAQDIIVNNKTIYTIDDFKLGIEENQLEKIKKYAKKHKELASIYVKDGIAFLPPLFLGFLLMFFI